MAIDQKKLQSIFPDYPREQKIIDDDGKLNNLWDLGLSSLFQGLQKNFKNEGIMFPLLSADNITKIQDIYTPLIGQPLPSNIPDISGQTVFDSTNKVPKQFIITYSGNNIATASWKTFMFVP